MNKIRVKFKVCLSVALLVGLFFSNAVLALNAQQYRPQVGAYGGYNLFTTEPLQSGEYAFSLQTSYAKNPLEITQNVGAGVRVLGVVDDLVTSDLGLAFGLSKVLALQVSLPVHVYHNIAPTLQPTRDKGYFELGDLRLALPITVFDPNQTTSGWGLAFVPGVMLDTGNSDVYGSDDTFGFSGTLAVEKLIHRLSLYTNVGVEIRDSETFLNLDLNDRFLFGLGASYDFSEKNPITLAAEFTGSTQLDNLFQREDETPFEILGILKKSWEMPNSNLQLSAYLGGGAGLTSGFGSPDYRIVNGLSLAFLKPKTYTKKKGSVDTSNETNTKLYEKLYFDLNSAKIKSNDKSLIQKIAQYIQERQIKKITIHGYADGYGATHEYNLNLAKRRAQAIANYLKSMEVYLDEIEISENVIGTQQTPVEENRRVEIQE